MTPIQDINPGCVKPPPHWKPLWPSVCGDVAPPRATRRDRSPPRRKPITGHRRVVVQRRASFISASFSRVLGAGKSPRPLAHSAGHQSATGASVDPITPSEIPVAPTRRSQAHTLCDTQRGTKGSDLSQGHGGSDLTTFPKRRHSQVPQPRVVQHTVIPAPHEPSYAGLGVYQPPGLGALRPSNPSLDRAGANQQPACGAVTPCRCLGGQCSRRKSCTASSQHSPRSPGHWGKRLSTRCGEPRGCTRRVKSPRVLRGEHATTVSHLLHPQGLQMPRGTGYAEALNERELETLQGQPWYLVPS